MNLPVLGTLSIMSKNTVKLTVMLKIAFSSLEQQQGMIGESNMNYALGFLVNPGYNQFWMKNCQLPLDIVFCKDQTIIKIFSNCLPCLNGVDKKCEIYAGVSDFVFELPALTCSKKQIKIGDFFQIYVDT
jgi:uncharacterized membrane protein (UPF0127 family)